MFASGQLPSRPADQLTNMTMTHPTRYFHALDDGRVQCDVCPRACKMHEGQRGLCFVRGVEAGEVKLYTYGRSSGFCVDPIEKKVLRVVDDGPSPEVELADQRGGRQALPPAQG